MFGLSLVVKEHPQDHGRIGDAAYNHPGIAQRIRPPGRLRDALLAPETDDELRRRYLAFLISTALLPFNWRNPTDAQLRAIARRIADLLA